MSVPSSIKLEKLSCLTHKAIVTIKGEEQCLEHSLLGIFAIVVTNDNSRSLVLIAGLGGRGQAHVLSVLRALSELFGFIWID